MPGHHQPSTFRTLLLLAILASPLSAAEPANPAITVPPGFTVELVAGPPLVERPIMGSFDDRGRLYLAESAGKNLNFDDLLKETPNFIRRLEDTDGDGRFDKSTIFADKMTFPQGALWHAGSVYVAAPPYIWKLTDTDDDGVADIRQQLVGTFGSNGNAADIHGCFLGPDGRIYWCDGRHGHEFPDQEGKPGSKGLAARVFSCRPDGSDVETFCGGGMDNPVEVAFTETGEMLGTMTFYNPDDARHDALVHFVHGGVYPKKHDCVNEFKRTGELMPAVSIFGVVAPAGLCRYRGSLLGEEYQENLFSCQFNTHKIVRHQLTASGASFSSADSDFLVAASPDFHPTDVLEDADGSLLVVDTGGWFRIGCPTSQIAKPDILGGIYRIRRANATGPNDPRGLALDWTTATVADLVARLDDDRPAVRDRATTLLAAGDETVVQALRDVVLKSPHHRQARQAMWALCQNGTEPARRAIRAVLKLRPFPESRLLAAIRSAGTLRDEHSAVHLLDIVSTGTLPVRREAATSLGRIGKAEAVPALLASLRTAEDRFLEHALIYGLIEINDPAATAAGLSDPVPQVRRGALIALDQMDAGNLARDQVAPLLDTDDVALQQTVLDVIAKRPGWSDEILGLLGGWLTEPAPSDDRTAALRGVLLAFRAEPQVQALLAETLAAAETPAPTRILLLEAIARSELNPLPDSWSQRLRESLDSSDPLVLRQAVATASATGIASCDDRLAELGRDPVQPTELRVAAVAALARRALPLDDDALKLLLDQLTPDTPPDERLTVAEALSAATLTDAQLLRLAELVARTGPLELRALVRSFQRAHSPEVGLALLSALEKSPGLTSLTPAGISVVIQNYPGPVQSSAEPLLARLAPDAALQRERLARFVALCDGGDPARGRDVFLGKRAACTACHRTAGQGGNVGPDLSKIGEVRTHRDLVEALLFPSASFARGYESVTILTTAGFTHTGVVSRESADSLYLRTAERAEIRVPRTDIDDLAASPLSIMPQGLEKTMTPAELADLVAYLRSLK